jgi:SAM-dependent methyltransferase
LSAVKVIDEISPQDEMYTSDPARYGELGEAALRAIRIALHAAGKPDPSDILDMPSGHGRVTRVLKAAFPDARLSACDIETDAIEFCARVFDATPIQGRVDPSTIELAGPYDLIWCGSLLTHVDSDRWPGFLRLFESALKPDGVAVFTVHGRKVIRNFQGGATYGLDDESRAGLLADFEATGFGYRHYWGREDYGISLSAPGWVFGQLGPRVYLYSEALWGSQDVVAFGSAQAG